MKSTNKAGKESRAKGTGKKTAAGARPGKPGKQASGAAPISRRREKDRWRELVETSAAWIWETDADIRHTYTNAFVTRCLGYRPAEFLSLDTLKLIHPDDRKVVTELVQNAVARREGWSDKILRWRHKDGSWKYIESSGSALFDDQGNFAGLCGVDRDITDRKRTEQALQESEERYRQLFEAESDAIFLIDNETGRILMANSAAVFLYGYSRDALLKKKNTDLSAEPSETRRVTEETPIVKENAVTIPLRYHQKKDGTVFPVEITGRFFNYQGRAVHIAAMRDITERKRAEEEISEREAMLQQILDTSSVAIFLVGKAGRITHANRRMAEMFGCAIDELIGSEYAAHVHPAERETGRRNMLALLASEIQSVDLERHYWMKDGNEFWGHLTGRRFHDVHGNELGLIGVIADVTERKKAEAELREKESTYRTLFESANDAIFIQDETGFTDCNQKGAEMHGLPKEKIIGRSQIEFAPERQSDGRLSSEVAGEKVHAALNGIPQVFEWQAVRADGVPLDVEITLSRLEMGGKMRLQAIVRDITERKRAEDALRASEERFRAITMTASDAILLMDDAGKIVYWNPAAGRIFGYASDEAVGKALHMFLAPQRLHAEYHKGFARFVTNGQGPVINRSVEMAALKKGGAEFPIEISTSAMNINGKWHALGIVRDITERKRVEEKMRKYSADLHRLLTVSREMTATTDVVRLYRASVQTAADLLGFDFSSVMVLSDDKAGLTIMDSLGFPQSMIGHYSLVEGQGLSTYVVKNKRPDTVVDFLTETRFDVPAIVRKLNIRSALCVPMMLGETVFGVLIGHTLEKRTFSREETAIYENLGNAAAIAIKNATSLNELARSEAKLRNITSNIAEGLYVLDGAGRITFMNEEAERLLGWSVEELNERGAHQLIHFRKADGTPLPPDACPMHGSIAGKMRFASNDEVFVRKDGTVFPISVVCSPIIEAGDAVASVIAFRDITETKRLEQELLKIQKLESVGTLAGGIAHDFNNLLQGIFGYISMAKLTIDQKGKSLAMLEQAEKAMHQSVSLTSQLLTFSKGGKPVKKVLALQPIIENAVKFALSGSRVNHTISFADDLRLVEADEGQVMQVVQNIVLNADQAMPEGGTIAITTRNVAAHGPGIPAGLTPGDYVSLAVQDSGVGIPGQYLTKIFDPYFSTKEKGSGLGLATSYSIVKNHGGVIDVSSVPGKGTTFTVYLPATLAAQRKEEPSAAAGCAVGRTCRILVMDDEQLVRVVAGELLRELGHEVEFAEHGDAAIETYGRAKAESRPFDLVILDLTIRGGKGGAETLRELLKIDPGVKAVVSSGYSDNAETADYQAHGFQAFLKKPYDMRELTRVLDDVMA